MPVMSALCRLRQEEYKFELNLDYIDETLSQAKKQNCSSWMLV
jgi:hypothetical protein